VKSIQSCLTLSLFFACVCSVSRPLLAQDPVATPKPSTLTFTKDMTIYVSDFELDAQNVQVDQGSAVSQRRPGILERPQKREQSDPAAQAKKLVETMSQSIVSDLQKVGYKAQRLKSDDPKPTSGVWLHGIFTQVEEGSRLQRAVIGFGSDQAKMELFVTLTNLASPEKPLYTNSQEGASKDKPGAIITMNPYVAAAKFVMAKNAPENTVKSTASAISKDIVVHLQQH
jgi:hypothetical protein